MVEPVTLSLVVAGAGILAAAGAVWNFFCSKSEEPSAANQPPQASQPSAPKREISEEPAAPVIAVAPVAASPVRESIPRKEAKPFSATKVEKARRLVGIVCGAFKKVARFVESEFRAAANHVRACAGAGWGSITEWISFGLVVCRKPEFPSGRSGIRLSPVRAP